MNYKILGEELETLGWQLLNREVKQKALSHMTEIKNNKNKESNFDKNKSTNESHSFEEECKNHCDWIDREGDVEEGEESEKFAEEIEARVQKLYDKYGSRKVQAWVFDHYGKRTLPAGNSKEAAE